jgi:membrane protein implicated in regulation of membrane protease activity
MTKEGGLTFTQGVVWTLIFGSAMAGVLWLEFKIFSLLGLLPWWLQAIVFIAGLIIALVIATHMDMKNKALQQSNPAQGPKAEVRIMKRSPYVPPSNEEFSRRYGSSNN